MVIGRGGSEIDKLKAECEKKLGKDVSLNIVAVSYTHLHWDNPNEHPDPQGHINDPNGVPEFKYFGGFTMEHTDKMCIRDSSTPA